ncbi:hypothetical protein RUM44_011405 [Polyplax serrata]|uniref:Uncharacterized protein n=1 Tax=Polyplax serrata TaxID=468196 RepID=A0ABR1APY7_POLSC
MYPLSVLDVVEELKRESPPGMVESAVTGMCTLLEKAENLFSSMNNTAENCTKQPSMKALFKEVMQQMDKKKEECNGIKPLNEQQKVPIATPPQCGKRPNDYQNKVEGGCPPVPQPNCDPLKDMMSMLQQIMQPLNVQCPNQANEINLPEGNGIPETNPKQPPICQETVDNMMDFIEKLAAPLQKCPNKINGPSSGGTAGENETDNIKPVVLSKD